MLVRRVVLVAHPNFLWLKCSLIFQLQVHQFSNKGTEMALRVASLDYLGIVAARLRKDAVASKMDQNAIDRILKGVVRSVVKIT